MKLLIVITASLALAANSFADDGTVAFQNTANAAISIYNYTTLTTYRATAADNLVVGLFMGPTAATATSLVATASMGSEPAYGPGNIAGNDNLLIPGTNPGDTDYFQVAAWDASFGDTLAGMNACIDAGGYWGAPGSTSYGVFAPALPFVLSGLPAPGTVIFEADIYPGYFHAFTVTGAPEPGTLALTGLGAAALALSRRRK